MNIIETHLKKIANNIDTIAFCMLIIAICNIAFCMNFVCFDLNQPTKVIIVEEKP